jgi:hypothetical protein
MSITGVAPVVVRGPSFSVRRHAVVTPPTSQSYAFIKRVGGAAFIDESFAEIDIFAGDSVARLARRACKEFAWGSPSQVRLFLAAPGGTIAPSLREIETALSDAIKGLGEGLSLAEAGVVSGSWLLASVLPAAAPQVFDLASAFGRLEARLDSVEAKIDAVDATTFISPTGAQYKFAADEA